jgi:hypothetical protein
VVEEFILCYEQTVRDVSVRFLTSSQHYSIERLYFFAEPSMRGKVDELIKELDGLRIQQARSRARQEEILTELREEVLQETEETNPDPDFEIGERVHINTTRNSRPHGTAATERDRTATVTQVTPSQKYVRMDNGFHTWRARGNVTPLPRLVHFLE